MKKTWIDLNTAEHPLERQVLQRLQVTLQTHGPQAPELQQLTDWLQQESQPQSGTLPLPEMILKVLNYLGLRQRQWVLCHLLYERLAAHYLGREIVPSGAAPESYLSAQQVRCLANTPFLAFPTA